jgi:enamine deaminase RidA (YjgF/YER057c/UK114 family)
MAHKDAESVPYIGIDDISFLKRDFKYHADLRTIVAPIELDSIYKKFYWIKKSSECPLSSEEQFGAYTDGAIREAFLHGEEFYHEFLGKLRHIVSLNPSLQGVISFIPYAEMLETLKPDYVKGSQIHKPRKFFAESVGLLTDTDADFESTFTDFIGDF